MLYKQWEVAREPAEEVAAFSREVGVGELVSRVLLARGVRSPEEARAFLGEDAPLPDPATLADMAPAVERIRRAIAEEEPMVIFGDYDVDGITATALLYTYLEAAGGHVYYKLPNRSTDEYGLMPSVVEQVAEQGISLILTVDNGTSALEAAQRAAELGVDIVMTDHHLPPSELPEVVALVNPCRADDDSGCECLSGVGVAFMLVAALEECPPEELLELFGDLVAIGTVADVMKLVGINRTLVRRGLLALQDTRRPGLAALIEACGWKSGTVTAENISYGIAPRLNAAGRMDDATTALELLLAEDEETAAPLVECLLEHNTARQKAEGEILDEIFAQVESTPDMQRAPVLVVWGEGWHQGVIGIVASRLVDRFAKPALVISFDGEEGRGSGRSVAGFSLHAAIASAADLLVRFGGHDLAAGFSLRRENLAAFCSRLNEWARSHHPVPAAPVMKADCALPLARLTLAEVEGLEALAPFGSGNPVPRFLLEGVTLDGVWPVSEGKHVRLRLAKDGATLTAVLFGTGPDQLAYAVGDKLDVLVTLSVYQGRGEPMISARVVELRPAGLTGEHVQLNALFESFEMGADPSAEQREALAPSREDVASVYRAIRADGGVSCSDLRPLFSRLGEGSTGRIRTALAALEELGLIRREAAKAQFATVPVAEKKDLTASALLARLQAPV